MEQSVTEKERLEAIPSKSYESVFKVPVCDLGIAPQQVISLFIRTCARGRDFWAGQARAEMEEGAEGKVPMGYAILYADTISRLVYTFGGPDIRSLLEEQSDFYKEVGELEVKWGKQSGLMGRKES